MCISGTSAYANACPVSLVRWHSLGLLSLHIMATARSICYAFIKRSIPVRKKSLLRITA